MKKLLFMLMLLFGVSTLSAQTVIKRTVVSSHPVIKPVPPGTVIVTKKKVVRHRPIARRRHVRKTTVIVPGPPPPTRVVETRVIVP